MAISDLFDNEFRKRNTDHFATIVSIAMSDNVISEEEQAFLNRLSNKLNISETDYKEILKNYASYPVSPPVSYDIRLERLYDLTRMVMSDGIKEENEMKLLQKFCVGLGFRAVNVKYITEKALDLVRQGNSLEEFTYGIKNMNQ